MGVSDQIADRGEKLELLVDKTEDLSANVRPLSSDHLVCFREYSGSVVECLSRDREVAGSSITALCPWARDINPCLVLVQPRKTHPNITEKLLTGT